MVVHLASVVASPDVNLVEVGGVAVTAYLRDDVVPAGNVVWPAGFARRDSLVTLVPAVGDWTIGFTNNRGAIWVKHDGLLSVDDGGGSLTIDGAVTIQEPLSVDDGGGSLTVDGAVDVTGSTVAVAGTVDVDIVAQSVGDITIADGGNSITVDGTVVATTGVAIGDALGATDPVWPAGVVRDDALTTLPDPDGDYTVPRVSAVGSLWVSHADVDGKPRRAFPDGSLVNLGSVVCSPSNGIGAEVTAQGELVTCTSYTEGAAPLGPGTGFVWPAGVLQDDVLPTSIGTDGTFNLLRVSAQGALWTREFIMVDHLSQGSGGQPIAINNSTFTTLHQVTLSRDVFTIYCYNPNAMDDIVLIRIGSSGTPVGFFVPAGETVITVDRAVAEFTGNGIAAQSTNGTLHCFGRVERHPELFGT